MCEGLRLRKYNPTALKGMSVLREGSRKGTTYSTGLSRISDTGRRVASQLTNGSSYGNADPGPVSDWPFLLSFHLRPSTQPSSLLLGHVSVHISVHISTSSFPKHFLLLGPLVLCNLSGVLDSFHR